MMNEEDLVRILREEISQSESDLYIQEESRAIALDYYNSMGMAIEDPAFPVCEGRSKLVSNDVGDTVDACMAQMMPSFNDVSAVFEPSSEQDEDAADTESKIVNYYLMDKNRGYNLIHDALFDALLEKNCMLKTYWTEDESVSNRKFEGLNVQELQQRVMEVLQDETSEITDFNEDDDGYSLEIRTVQVDAYPKVEVFAPEDVRVNSDHDNVCLRNARFVAHKPRDVTESDLIAAGYDRAMVADLPGYEYNQDMAVSSRSMVTDTDANKETTQANRYLDYYEIYCFVDWNGDGIAERRRIVMVGRTILENEEVPYTSILSGCTMPVPHQFWGQSLFDKVQGIQDAKTVLLRQVIDNTALNINNRLTVIPDQILQPDELMTSRPGGIIQVQSQDAVQPLMSTTIDQSAMGLMAYMDKMRTERAGSALDMTSEAIPVGGNATAHGTERIITSMEQMQSQMTTSFSELVIRELYIQIHSLLRQHATDGISVRIGNKFIQSDPRQWPARDKVNVQVGVSAGERTRKAKAMSAVVQNQLMMLQLGGGGTMLTPKNMYNANADLGQFMGLDFPEQYFTDPESPEAQQAAQQQQQAQMQQKQEAEQKEQMAMKFQAGMQEMQEETKREKTKADDDQFYENLAFEYDKLMSEHTEVMTKIEVDSDKDIPGSAV